MERVFSSKEKCVFPIVFFFISFLTSIRSSHFHSFGRIKRVKNLANRLSFNSLYTILFIISFFLAIWITHILCRQNDFSYFCIDATLPVFTIIFHQLLRLCSVILFAFCPFLSVISIQQLNYCNICCPIFQCSFFGVTFRNTKDANNSKCSAVIANVSS